MAENVIQFPSYADRQLIASMVSTLLIEIQAVHFNARTPYHLTSGWASPVYVDCRRIISFPRARQAIVDFSIATIQREIGFESIDTVAGGETAGIPFAAWIADRLGLPMLYVRKKPKAFGRESQIEGVAKPGSQVLLVEDLATDGASKINFVEALRAAGTEVSHLLVVFYYGTFASAGERLSTHKLRLHALATWWDVLRVARAKNYFDEATLDEVESFLKNPAAWSLAHGGAGEDARA